MRRFIEGYHRDIVRVMRAIAATDSKNRTLRFIPAIESACRMIQKRTAQGGRVFFIGNGGSAAIASHMAVDFWKNGKIPAMCFNDSSLLTCISNDYGYQHVFEKPLVFFSNSNDILFAISSSGKSSNILQAVKAAREKKCSPITFSGFEENNPLRSLGVINFYVPSLHYGYVEVVHQYICHLILDALMCNHMYARARGNRV